MRSRPERVLATPAGVTDPGRAIAGRVQQRTLLAAGTAVAATLVVATLPSVNFAYRNPLLHLALETSEGLVALLAAFMFYGHEKSSGTRRDRLAFLAFSVFGVTNLTLGTVPLVIEGRRGPFVVWATLALRLIGAASLAAAALARGTASPSWTRRTSTKVVGCAVVSVALVLVFEARLPDVGEPPGQFARPVLEGTPTLLVSQALLFLLFAVAAFGFARAARSGDDPMLAWLAPATALGAVARLNYLLFPSLYSDYVYIGDLLRLLFYVLVTVGLVNEIRRSWLRLEESNRAIRAYADFQKDMVATVSHELRTPLTAIRGFAELLAAAPGAAAPDAPAAVIVRNVDRLESLVGDLLVVSEIQDGSLQLDLAPVDLRAVVETVVEALGPAAERRSVTLATALPEQPVRVRGDRRRLEQIVANLVGNGVKFTVEGGRVNVTCTSGERGAEIVVEDDGPGIPESERARVFERFYRSKAAGKSAVPGTGLGLAIVRDLTHAHGGQISVDDAAGGGARFTLRLPAPSQDAPA